MLVRMKTNLGTVHAREHDLNHVECMSGKEVIVTDSVANWLLSNGMAEEVEDLKAVPQPEIGRKPAVANSKTSKQG